MLAEEAKQVPQWYADSPEGDEACATDAENCWSLLAVRYGEAHAEQMIETAKAKAG